jgi:hypothetical protein
MYRLSLAVLLLVSLWPNPAPASSARGELPGIAPPAAVPGDATRAPGAAELTIRDGRGPARDPAEDAPAPIPRPAAEAAASASPSPKTTPRGPARPDAVRPLAERLPYHATAPPRVR